MISFHPTISVRRCLALTRRACLPGEPESSLERLFPHHATTLTDSGRSALALVIEALDLEGKTMLLPAYVCDVLLPVLVRYRIRPIFLDIDPDTYQPPKSAYAPDVLGKADAVLLVATYGRSIDRDVTTLLCKHSVRIIEDFAHCPLPSEPETTIDADARYYSLPKMLPVPDGGLAVLKATAAPTTPIAGASVPFTNWVKLFSVSNALWETAKFVLKRRPVSSHMQLPSWSRIRRPGDATRRLLCHFLGQNTLGARWHPTPWQYCLPIRVKDPDRARRMLFSRGIAAERLWHDPIVFHNVAREHFGADPDAFPETAHAARETVCVPLWHLKSESAYQRFRKELEEILAGEKTDA